MCGGSHVGFIYSGRHVWIAGCHHTTYRCTFWVDVIRSGIALLSACRLIMHHHLWWVSRVDNAIASDDCWLRLLLYLLRWWLWRHSWWNHLCVLRYSSKTRRTEICKLIQIHPIITTTFLIEKIYHLYAKFLLIYHLNAKSLFIYHVYAKFLFIYHPYAKFLFHYHSYAKFLLPLNKGLVETMAGEYCFKTDDNKWAPIFSLPLS